MARASTRTPTSTGLQTPIRRRVDVASAQETSSYWGQPSQSGNERICSKKVEEPSDVLDLRVVAGCLILPLHASLLLSVFVLSATLESLARQPAARHAA